MLGLVARRGRQKSSLARALIEHGGAVPRLVSNSFEEAPRAGRHWTSLAGLYEIVKLRGAAGFLDARKVRDGAREFVHEARCGGRRTFTESRKANVAVEAAAVPGASSSKLNFVAWYLRNLDRRPLLTKSLTAGTIYTTSDLCSQV